jgi:hypothetical protein
MLGGFTFDVSVQPAEVKCDFIAQKKSDHFVSEGLRLKLWKKKIYFGAHVQSTTSNLCAY